MEEGREARAHAPTRAARVVPTVTAEHGGGQAKFFGFSLRFAVGKPVQRVRTGILVDESHRYNVALTGSGQGECRKHSSKRSSLAGT